MTTVLLLLCSCSDDDKTEDLLPQEEEQHLISVSATTQDFTRADKTTMDNLQRNGFSVVCGKLDPYGYLSTYDGFSDNCVYDATEEQWNWEKDMHYWTKDDENGGGYIPLEFFALYTPTEDIDLGAVMGDQITVLFQNGNQGTADIMLATLYDASYETNNGVLLFDFKHILANVTVAAQVTSEHSEAFEYYTVKAVLSSPKYVEYAPKGYEYDDFLGEKWYYDEEKGTIDFNFEDSDARFYTTDNSPKALGSNYFLVPNTDTRNRYYDLKVICYGYQPGDANGTLLKELSTKVNLNGCEGKNVVLNLNIDLHNDEIVIDTKHFHTSLDAPAVRITDEN